MEDRKIITIEDLRNRNFELSGESAAMALEQGEKRATDSFERKATIA